MKSVFIAAVAMTALSALAKGNPEVAVLIGVVLVGVLLRPILRTAGGRAMVVRTHGGHGTKLAATHEGGHVALVKAAGGRVLDARIYPDGSGITRFKLPADVPIADVIAIDVAGEVASGTRAGCDSDQGYMRAALATLPPGERNAARKAGYARASGVVNGFFTDGGVSTTAEKLLRDGNL